MVETTKKLSVLYSTVILFIIFSISTTTFSQFRPSNWAIKKEIQPFFNFYSINDSVYRSEQPNSIGMKKLDSIGFKTIINLRNLKSDKHEALNTNLKLIHVPINTWTINYDEMVWGIKEIVNAPKPVLVHCKHGSDRTGCIIAGYRIAIQGWNKTDTINEFRLGGYGFHEAWFRNIIKLLESINENQLRKDCNTTSIQ